jgi:myosin heavy subunit
MQIVKSPANNLNTSLKPISSASTELFDPMADFDFLTVNDDSLASRDRITAVAHELFGSTPDVEELVARLVEYMLSVSASRQKIAAELVILGGSLANSMALIIENHTAKVGYSVAAENKARELAYKFFKMTLRLSSHAVRKYSRCFHKFGVDHEAVQLFNIGELNILSAHDVTEAQISRIMEEKKKNGKMTQDDVQELLNDLRRKEEELADKDRELENVQELLEDRKDQLRGAESDFKRLKEQLIETNRALQAKEKKLLELSDFVKERTAGHGQLQKDFQDKSSECKRLIVELAAAKQAKPVIQTVDVIREVVPEGYQLLADALKTTTQELEDVERKKQQAEKELAAKLAELESARADVDSASSVRQTLNDLINAWEPFAAKFTTAQLVVQASTTPTDFTPTLEALAGMLRKCLSEITTATTR